MSKKKERTTGFGKLINVTFFTLVLCAIAASYTLSVFTTYFVTLERSVSDTKVILNQVGKNINNYIDNAKNYTAVLSENASLQIYLKGQGDKEQDELYLKSFDTFVARMSVVYKDVIAVCVFDVDGKPIYVSDGFAVDENYNAKSEDWYNKVANSRSKVEMSALADQHMIKEMDGDTVIVLSRVILDENSNRKDGTVAVYLRYNIISNTVKNIDLGSNGFVFILDKAGNIVYYPEGRNFGDSFDISSKELLTSISRHDEIQNMDGGMLLLNTGSNNYANIFGVTYPYDIISRIGPTFVSYALIAGILIFVMLVLTRFLTGKVTAPVAELVHSMNTFQQGGSDLSFPDSNISEIKTLSHSLESMISTIEDLVSQNIEKQKKINAKELQILWTQINPHLLYNSMDAIVSTAESGDTDKVIAITLALSKYFRIALSSGDDFITVRDEISHVKNYLIIQNIRYEKLRYEIDADPSVMECRIPKLLLQPIVENSIYHGIKYNKGGGTVKIKVSANGESICFCIEDDGRGMRREELARVFDEKDSIVISRGIGLSNISERLKLYYGDKGMLQIESKFKKGTSVIIILPREMSG